MGSLSDPFHFRCLDEILLMTRQRGVSVEQHFYRYGVFSKHDGERRIDMNEFREALISLRIGWAVNTDAVKSLYKQIETIFS